MCHWCWRNVQEVPSSVESRDRNKINDGAFTHRDNAVAPLALYPGPSLRRRPRIGGVGLEIIDSNDPTQPKCHMRGLWGFGGLSRIGVVNRRS